MNTTMHQYAFILGTHAQLSFAELSAVLDGTVETIELQNGLAFATSKKPLDADALMNMLGGTIKIVEMIGDFDEDLLLDWLFEQIDTTTKFNFGFSLYPLESGVTVKKHFHTMRSLGIQIKKAMRSADISARFVESKEPALSSVIVHKERLLKNGVDIVLLKGHDGIQFGRTLAVQPFGEFSKRDYGRPGHDAKSGMLPPKVARMMINIARPEKTDIILDPFCGSGTIVQEAFLMGYEKVVGSDKSKQAVADTRKNLEWLQLPEVPLYVTPAEQLIDRGVMKPDSVDRIIFEGYLGPQTPRREDIQKIRQELDGLYTEVFKTLAKLLKKNGRIVAALPFWSHNKKESHLALDVIVKKSGLKMTGDPLHYRRAQSVVGREISILRKR